MSVAQGSTAADAATGEGAAINPELARALAQGDCDFLDFGCSDGGSYRFAMERLGGKRGIGLDIDPAKVAKARANGVEAYEQDVTRIAPLRDSVRMVLLSHFLEHLPSADIAARCVRSAISAARDFVLVRHPFFDSNGPLMQRGFKLYSADWNGHRNLMTSYDVWRAARPALEAGRVRMKIFGRMPIADSSHPAIVALDAPADITKRRLAEFADKPLVSFDFPMYKELVAVIVKLDGDGKPRCDVRSVVRELAQSTRLAEF